MRPTLALALLLAGCGGPSAAAPTTPSPTPRPSACAAPTVRLAFAWPPGVSAFVRGLDVTESQNDDGSAPMRGESRQELRMQTEAAEGGAAVTFTVAGATRTRSQGFAPDIGGERPTVVLGADGEVVRVLGADRMRLRMLELAAQGQIDPETVRHVEPNLSADAQLDTAQSHWRWVTGVWNGRRMRCGETVTQRERVPGMGLGVGTVNADVSLTYERQVECPGASNRTCVVLRADVAADPAEVAAALRQRIGGGPAQLRSGAIDRKIRVIVEPDTLLPHRVVFEERQRLAWDDPGGGYERHVRDVQTYEMEYRTPL